MDGDLYRFVVIEYNNQFNKQYEKLAFPHVTPSQQNHPSVFSQINPDSWYMVKKSLEDVLKLYDDIIHKWRRSGFHDDLPEPHPFSDYAHNNHLILYFHEFIQMYDGLFEKMTGKFYFYHCLFLNITSINLLFLQALYPKTRRSRWEANHLLQNQTKKSKEL